MTADELVKLLHHAEIQPSALGDAGIVVDVSCVPDSLRGHGFYPKPGAVSGYHSVFVRPRGWHNVADLPEIDDWPPHFEQAGIVPEKPFILFARNGYHLCPCCNQIKPRVETSPNSTASHQEATGACRECVTNFPPPATRHKAIIWLTEWYKKRAQQMSRGIGKHRCFSLGLGDHELQLAAIDVFCHLLPAMRRYGGGCAYCGRAEDIGEDHVVPRHKGGHHVVENLVPCCRQCNSRKQARLLGSEYTQLRRDRGEYVGFPVDYFKEIERRYFSIYRSIKEAEIRKIKAPLYDALRRPSIGSEYWYRPIRSERCSPLAIHDGTCNLLANLPPNARVRVTEFEDLHGFQCIVSPVVDPTLHARVAWASLVSDFEPTRRFPRVSSPTNV